MRKWLNRKVVAEAVKAVHKTAVRAKVADLAAGLPKRRDENLVKAEIMPLQKAND